MKLRFFVLLACAAALGVLAAVALAAPTPGDGNGAPAAAAGPTTTDSKNVRLCHRTGSSSPPWVLISVSRNAVPAHLRRGDTLPRPDGTCPNTLPTTTTTTRETTASTTTAPTVRTQANQIRLCHRTDSGSHAWVPIWVSRRAVPAHLRRGDTLPRPDGTCPHPPRTTPTTQSTTTTAATTTP
jgi:hypothetical protein